MTTVDLYRLLSDLFRLRNKIVVWRSQGSYPTCFDQETKPSSCCPTTDSTRLALWLETGIIEDDSMHTTFVIFELGKFTKALCHWWTVEALVKFPNSKIAEVRFRNKSLLLPCHPGWLACLLACMHADKARTTYCGIPSVDTLWDDCHVELSKRKRSNQGSISRIGTRLCAIPTVYTTRTMVSALMPNLMRMQLLSRLLSDLFRSRNKTVTCFDQETKPSCPWPKATLFYFLFFIFFTALPCPCPCPALFRIFLLLPGTGGGSYTWNFFSFFCQGQEEEVTPCTTHPVLP